ncbi:GNAT family N-acetyltransferase [Undibacterium flavidum]|uniref:GNAT family N-acetyltransferase n=1 Tax=Undibacterium flavidum TaxID=2762297 RepID=A0ABR6Y7W7_9BURK|nr:GNAT family protein [Undibacterium flavidum]MBC3872691.1 GNAT family N-acetyltransferase [Undibacterium flavidum]
MIRPVQQSDFDFIYKLYMHPEVNPYLLYEHMDKESFAPIFAELLRDGVLYVFSEQGEDIGMCKLIRLKHRTSHIAYLGGVAIDPAKAGKGYAHAMFSEIIALGQSMQLARIELSASVENLRAIRLYEKCGFEREGILRRYTYLRSEDRYLDEVLMSYLY